MSSRDTQLIAKEVVEVREPVITKVIDQPIIEQVKEVKNVAVIHKDIVQEIREQPIIEIAKKKEVRVVQEQPFVQKIVAPTKFEDIKTLEFSTPTFVEQKAPVHSEEVGDVKRVVLPEELKEVTRQEYIERHIVPTVTEIREQKVINVIEQPIVRKITEKPIIREISWHEEYDQQQQFQQTRLTDTSFEFERKLPAVQESTHVLMAQHPHGPLSSEVFADELSRGKATLREGRPFSTEAFKEEIMYGQEVLHTARPFGQEAFMLELKGGKKLLKKSRYFSKDAFLIEFMAQKKLLKPVESNMYSLELSKLGHWKGDSILASATDLLWNTYENVASKVKDTYETVKERIVQQE